MKQFLTTTISYHSSSLIFDGSHQCEGITEEISTVLLPLNASQWSLLVPFCKPFGVILPDTEPLAAEVNALTLS